VFPEEIGKKASSASSLEVLHPVLREQIEGVPSFVVELNALAGHRGIL
jgi:hypothetical protein